MLKYKVINKKGKEITTSIALHPGEVLEMELSARDIKKNVFAQSLGLKPSHLSELLHGKRHVSAALAIKLEGLLDIRAEYWLNVQMAYDLKLARHQMDEAA